MTEQSNKTVSLFRKVESLGMAVTGAGIFVMGGSYFREQALYRVPRILMPVYKLLGNVGLAVGIKIKLEEGNHTIDCKKYNLHGKAFKTESPFGVINPTGSKYVTYNVIYKKNKLCFLINLPHALCGLEPQSAFSR